MVRLSLSAALALAVLASPAHAATERATIAVSLRVEATCAARVESPRKPGEPAVGIDCATQPWPSNGEPAVEVDCATQPPSATGEPAAKPAYVVRTVNRPEGTVVSFEF